MGYLTPMWGIAKRFPQSSFPLSPVSSPLLTLVRMIHKRATMGKPDHKDLNENLAATQGLSHMITDCKKLFQVLALHFWRNLDRVSLTIWHTNVWDIALSGGQKQLANKLRVLWGPEEKKDGFVLVWSEFISFVSKEEHGPGSTLDYKRIWLL